MLSTSYLQLITHSQVLNSKPLLHKSSFSEVLLVWCFVKLQKSRRSSINPSDYSIEEIGYVAFFLKDCFFFFVSVCVENLRGRILAQ